jgi:hypothetical protein
VVRVTMVVCVVAVAVTVCGLTPQQMQAELYCATPPQMFA